MGKPVDLLNYSVQHTDLDAFYVPGTVLSAAINGVGELLTQCTKRKKKRQAWGKQLQQIAAFVAQSNTLCDPTDCSTSGFSVLHYLLEFAQTHVH